MACGSVCSGQAEGETAPEADAKPVRVSDYDTVTLSVQDTELSKVLQLLSIQGRRNIVPSPKVSGTVTANLYDVTFEQALDAILQQNGAGYMRKGEFIYVYTQDELEKIRQAERQVEPRVFRLNYLTATDASTFITPMLSPAGSIAISGDVESGFKPSIGDGGANTSAHVDTMIVHDYEANLKRISKVVKSLDVRPRQVLVEATILEARISEDNAFGVDFSILTNAAMQSFTGGPFEIVNNLISGTIQPAQKTGTVRSTVGGVDPEKGGIVGGFANDDVAVFIQALDSITDTTIIANPKVLALNRQRAEVLIGQKLGYVSTTSTSTSTTQTVEFLDVGTQLTLRPFVSDDGYIRLELRPQVSNGTVEVTDNFTIPNETTNELTTNVMVRDGQTIVLGGLFKEETVVERDQVPGLGEIPLAGELFKGRSDDVNRAEIIFLITPHIVKDDALEAAGQATAEGVEMIRLGARKGLLPWSRSKMTAAHLRRALDAIEAGDDEKALWQVDLALGLEPRQVEAIRLKEKLTGRRVYWPNRSLMSEALDLMVRKTTGRREPARPIEPSPSPAEPKDFQPPPSPAPPGSPLPEDGDVLGDDEEDADGAEGAEGDGETDGGATEATQAVDDEQETGSDDSGSKA